MEKEMMFAEGHFIYSDECNYTETMTVKQWQDLVQKHGHKHIVKGRLRTFRARNIGGGMVEVYKTPLKEAL